MNITYCRNGDSQCTLLNIVDCGTEYSEGTVLRNRVARTLITSLDSALLYLHGAPKFLSGDDDFNKPILINALKIRNITFLTRTTRIHKMLGNVERKNRTMKAGLEWLTKSNTDITDKNITQKAILLANILAGNKHMSELKLARGYARSIYGIQSARVTS